MNHLVMSGEESANPVLDPDTDPDHHKNRALSQMDRV